MTEHSGAAHTDAVTGAPARRPRADRDRRVSERIYDYISTGRVEQQQPRRRSHPPAAS
jgi:hypothetical protein